MNFLFICSRNRLRSPTAESVAIELGLSAQSAGVAPDADTELTQEHILWADKIIAMESVHKSKITKKFSHLLKNKKVIVWNIKDNYEFMQPELIKILQEKLSIYTK